MKDSFKRLLTFFIVFSTIIIIIGTFETVKNQYMFGIVEDNLLNSETTTTAILDDYYDFRNNYIFTNNFFLDFLNWVGVVALFYIFVAAFKDGWQQGYTKLNNIFLSYGFLMIMLIYIAIIVINYLKDILINQIVVVLFSDVYNAFHPFVFFIDNFIWILIACYCLSWFATTIRNLNFLKV